MTRRIICSIIIPTYNEEEDIIECLDSLKKQSFKKFEVLIVDDGSIDKTKELCKSFARKSNLQIKILEQQHGGPGKARNLGASAAIGEILIFVDADMTFDKDYVKNLIAPLLKDKKIIGTNHDNEVAINLKKGCGGLWGKIRVNKQSAKENPLFRAIRKNKFLELGGFDSKYGYADDQTFLFKYGLKPHVADNTLCYHNNPETLSSTFKQARWIGASWKERYKVFKIPLINYFALVLLFLFLPFLVFIKTIIVRIKIKKSLLELIKFYSVKFLGYALGIGRAIIFRKNFK